MITTKEETHSGMYPMTKENTYYGFKVADFYVWYKSKKTVLKKVKGTKTEIYRATLIKNEMYINLRYLTLGRW